MQIHELIKAERLKAGLTEDQIAEKLEIPRATYQNWEKKPPSVEKIRAVAKVLNLSKDYFFINSDEEEVDNDENIGIVQEPPVQYETKRIIYNKGGDFLQALIEEKDKAIRKAEDFAQKMENHYEDMKSALERSQLAINDFLKPMATSLKDIPPVLDIIVRNSHEHDKEIMKALDQLVGNAPGTLEKESGKRILKGAVEQQKKGKG